MPKALREQLAAHGWRTGRAIEHAQVKAADGTRKLLLQLSDGRLVEAVGIPERDTAPSGGVTKHRLTACVSSQACTPCTSFGAPCTGFSHGCCDQAGLQPSY